MVVGLSVPNSQSLSPPIKNLKKIQMKHTNIKTIQTPKQPYSAPILKKLGTVLSITLKTGSVSDMGTMRVV